MLSVSRVLLPECNKLLPVSCSKGKYKGFIMAFSTQLISHPSPGVFEFLRQRVGTVGKKIFAEAEVPFTAVGLVQGKVVDMIAAADVAEKAGNVRVYDLKGICPQHVTMIGIFGDIGDVEASLAAIKRADHLK